MLVFFFFFPGEWVGYDNGDPWPGQEEADQKEWGGGTAAGDQAVPAEGCAAIHDVLIHHPAGEGVGREMYRLVSKKEANFRLEQVVWKECMFLPVVNTTFLF